MTSRLIPLILFFALGCGSSSVTATDDDKIVTVDGPLTLTVSDFATVRGVLWIAPTAEGAKGALNARSIQYGSLCALAVSGHADVAANRIVLHVAFSHRLTSCIDEVRALRYDAVIAPLAPGRYEVHIMHDGGFGTGEMEVRVQTVDVT